MKFIFLFILTLTSTVVSASEDANPWNQLRSLSETHKCSVALRREADKQILKQNFEFGKVAFNLLTDGLNPLKSKSDSHVFEASFKYLMPKEHAQIQPLEIFSTAEKIRVKALGFEWSISNKGIVLASRTTSSNDGSLYFPDFFSAFENGLQVYFKTASQDKGVTPYAARFEFGENGSLKELRFSTMAQVVVISDIKELK